LRSVFYPVDTRSFLEGETTANHLPPYCVDVELYSRPVCTFMARCERTRTLSDEAQNGVGSNEHARRHSVTLVTISLLFSSRRFYPDSSDWCPGGLLLN
jgi:hypothetical protein